jgi:hypothetical protein
MRSAVYVVAVCVGCGSGSSAKTKTDASSIDSPHGDSRAVDARAIDAALDASPFDAGPDAKLFLDAPAGTFPLVLKNYVSWCTVEINNSGSFSTATPQTVNVLPGTITLVAKPMNSMFELGTDMWHHVDGTTGDTGISGTQAGSGINATSTTTITITNAGACVWVCCPFSADGSGCNPALIGDQCP